MKRSEATLSEQGRITLPATVRAASRAKPGDRLIFDHEATGKVHVQVKADFGADQARRSEDLARLPALIEAARSRKIDALPDDPIGNFLVAEGDRTKSGR